MEKLLVINAHTTPNESIEQIDLYGEEIPEVNSTVLSAWGRVDGRRETRYQQNERILQQFSEKKKGMEIEKSGCKLTTLVIIKLTILG